MRYIRYCEGLKVRHQRINSCLFTSTDKSLIFLAVGELDQPSLLPCAEQSEHTRIQRFSGDFLSCRDDNEGLHKSAEMSWACWGLKTATACLELQHAELQTDTRSDLETPALISAECFSFAFQRAAGCQCLEVSTVQDEMSRCCGGLQFGLLASTD